MTPAANPALNRSHHDAVSGQRARDLEGVDGAAKRALSPDAAAAVPAKDDSNFADAARKMVKGAFHDLKHELKSALKGFGFSQGELGKMVKSLFEPIGEALRSGADFSAQVVVAAATQVTTATQGGVATALDLFAKSIDITVNHTTGEVSVDMTTVEIQAREFVSGASAGPQFLDFKDNETPEAVDLFSKFDEYLKQLSAAFEDVIPEQDTIEEKAAQAAQVIENDRVSAANESDDDDAVSAATATSARITLEAVERLVNDHNERITRLRFDAVFSLALNPPAPAPPPPLPAAIPAPEGPVEITV